jgi:hypothetical protein
MGVTKAQRISELSRAEEQGHITPDQSETVHEFADGWKIVRLTTCGDVRREGRLMRSCIPKYLGDTLAPGKKVVYDPCDKPDDDPAPSVDWDMIFDTDLSRHHYGLSLHSLRDAEGLPHLTFWALKDEFACGIYGFKNCEPKLKYKKRLDEWAATGYLERIAYNEDDASKNYLLMWAGLYSHRGHKILRRYQDLEKRVASHQSTDASRQAKIDEFADKAWAMTYRMLLHCGYIANARDILSKNRRELRALLAKGETPSEEFMRTIRRNRPRVKKADRRSLAYIRKNQARMEELFAQTGAGSKTMREWHERRTPKKRRRRKRR